MARTIGIIGIGHVGVTTAFNLVSKGVADKLVLIDKKAELAEGESFDLKDALGGLPTYTDIVVNDYDALKDADVVISAVGNIGAISNGDRIGETKTSKVALDDVAPKLKASGFHGVLLDITNPCDAVTSYWQYLLDLPKSQIIGTGTSLDTYRMRRAVAESLNVNVADVRGYNMGEHGESQFTAWSTVRVNNEPITDYAQVDYDQLADAARAGGWKIYQAKHYTSYGIATIATEMTQAIISDATRIFPCANYDPEFGIAIGHPATIGKLGVVNTPKLKLTDEERAKYVHSAGIIKATVEKMK